MKLIIPLIILLQLHSFNYSALSQEWSNLKSYQKETGNAELLDGCWLKKDRKKQNDIWSMANLYNLSLKDGNQKYKSICEIRDFYVWFDSKRKEQGHEIKAAGVAAIVANQFSKMEIGFVRYFVVRNKEIVIFADEGSQLVFEFAFPLMNNIYFSNEIIKGENAAKWSLKNGKIEQCQILEPLYNNMSPNALKRLDKMAKGKGIFFFGVPKQLKYEGDIEDCNARVEHAINKILPYYIQKID